jgi:tight adherence protein B
MLISFILTTLLVFMCIASLIWAGFFAWLDYLSPRLSQQEKRLDIIQSMNQDALASTIQYKRVLSSNDRIANYLKNFSIIVSLDKLLVHAGVALLVDQFLLVLSLSVFLIIGIGLFFSLHISLIFLLVAGIIAGFFTYLFFHKQRRRALIDDQLPEALDLISQAMQAGHALSSAILLASNEGSEPIASEFRWVFDEINYGLSTREAILQLSERVDSEYVRLFVTSVLIQIDTGGNMADLLKNTSFLIRDRKKFKAAARVLTAEARISALILGSLPFVIISLLTIINPGFISVLWHDDLGLKLLGASFGLMVIGALWIWRLIHFSY